MHGHVGKRVKMHIKQRVAQTTMVSISSHGEEKGKGVLAATGIVVMHPKWLHPNKASWASDVTTQPQTRYGRHAWQSLEQERLTQV